MNPPAEYRYAATTLHNGPIAASFVLTALRYSSFFVRKRRKNMFTIRRTTATALSLLATLASTTEAGAPAKTGDTSSSPSFITVPFTSAAPMAGIADTYAVCFDKDGKQTGCSGGKELLPPEVGVGPLKAGKKLLVILETDDCTKRDLYLQKQSITPTDANPVRGASPPKTPGTTAKFAFDGGAATYCYALYPDPLTSDTYTTVHIAKKDASVPPKEVDISSQPFALPEIHTFYQFGISTGVAVSSIQNKTFGYAAGSTATKFSTTTVSDPRMVEPILFLTYYPLHGGLDSEARGRWDDLGVVAGLSEKNPTSSFYLGISTEPIRNIAIIIGANATQVNVLDPSVYDSGPSATHSSPSTRQAYRYGGFVSIAFNFSNFLQQVFK